MQSAALGMLFMVLSSCSSRQGSELESCAETSQLKQLFGIRFCELFFVVNLKIKIKSVGAKFLCELRHDRQNALFLIMV
jgi:hypothetical protein